MNGTDTPAKPSMKKCTTCGSSTCTNATHGGFK